MNYTDCYCHLLESPFVSETLYQPELCCSGITDDGQFRSLKKYLPSVTHANLIVGLLIFFGCDSCYFTKFQRLDDRSLQHYLSPTGEQFSAAEGLFTGLH